MQFPERIEEANVYIEQLNRRVMIIRMRQVLDKLGLHQYNNFKRIIVEKTNLFNACLMTQLYLHAIFVDWHYPYVVLFSESL